MAEITYTVQEGDTLCSIAKAELGKASRYVEIVRLNGLRVATVVPGEVLRLGGK